jgi:hypothetical protein
MHGWQNTCEHWSQHTMRSCPSEQQRHCSKYPSRPTLNGVEQ